LARIGLGGIDLYCRSFVQPPQRIILDMDDIDDPSSNSPWCAVTATTAPSPALVLPGTMCRDYTLGFARRNLRPRRDDTHGHRRALHHHHLEGRGKALYEKSSGRENLIEDMEHLDAVPAWFAVAGKPACCT
jgi:hypothetical protein